MAFLRAFPLFGGFSSGGLLYAADFGKEPEGLSLRTKHGRLIDKDGPMTKMQSSLYNHEPF